MALVDDALDCEVLLVHDPAKPPEIEAFCLALNGGLAVSVEFLRSGGLRGPSVFYAKATSTRRQIYISAAFERANPSISAVVRAASARGNWQVIADQLTFLVYDAKSLHKRFRCKPC